MDESKGHQIFQKVDQKLRIPNIFLDNLLKDVLRLTLECSDLCFFTKSKTGEQWGETEETDKENMETIE